MLRLPVTETDAGGVLRDFEDGLGRRYRAAAPLHAGPLEVLCFRHSLTAVPAFEFALRERFARLSDFQHPSFVRIRKLDKLNDQHGTVTLLSDATLNIAEIGFLLGYSEPSAFTRAFKRWTGRSPSDDRRQS